MNKRRERTLQEICDATCPPSQHQVASENFKGLSVCSEMEAVDFSGKMGTCNVCSAPCSSCFHDNKVLMKSNDESAGETCGENIEFEQPSALSTVARLNSNSDSLSGNAVGKTSSRISNASASGESTMKNNKPSKVSGARSTQSTFSPISNGIYVSAGQYSRDVNDEKTSATNELLEGSTEPRDLMSPRGVASDVCGHPTIALNFIQKNELMAVEGQPVDEMESGMMEQDVKVCDICGDAGREDLLAICCCCSDGAEHTYCMRKMLTKVPEGEWLCEECQAQERTGKRRRENIGRKDKIEKNNSGYTSSEHVNKFEVDEQKITGLTRIPGKRYRDDDDAEVSSIVKKPALESMLGSPRPSSSGTVVLTRENPVKSIDKGRAQSQVAPVNDTSESGSSASDLRALSFRGTFSKSNSFSSLNLKPKVKLVDQAVIQRPKSVKGISSFRHKEGVARSIGKSMSFKSINPGRPESKVKMLSPRLSHIQDIRNTKLRSSFEREHAFRQERSSINSMMGGTDKRPSSVVTVANNDDTNPVQADSKSAIVSRSSSFAARRAADLTSSSGEFKRPPTHEHCTVGSPFANGVNRNENKVNRTNSKSDFFAAECSALNRDECISDGLTRPGDSTSYRDKMKDCFGIRPGLPSAMSAKNVGDNLKSASEATALRKLAVHEKNRVFSQSDESPVPTMGIEVTCHQDLVSSSVRNKKRFSEAELPERLKISRTLIADSHKLEKSNSVNQSSVIPVEGLSSAGRNGVHISSFRRDALSNVPAGIPFSLKTLAVPEHEYIWQGSFEICRSGKTIDTWDGIQAHRSTRASYKVTEVVNKFKSRISLYEVPLSRTWPIHFQEHGVREDNIALFFYAKDLDSYNKAYRVLLDNMMKNDLCLKGNVDGVELLIFSSSQLPDNSQRWNMLFFLWGVFKGNKQSFLQQMPESQNQLCTPRSIPSPIKPLPENRCSLRPIVEDLNGREDVGAQALETPASEELQRLLSSGVSNRDCDTKSLDRLGHQLNAIFPSVVPTDNENRCHDMMGISQANSHHNFVHDHSAAASERHFFPTAEPQIPWKHHHHNVLEQQQENDRETRPDLELALGAAERISRMPPIFHPFDLARRDHKVNAAEGDVEAAGAKVEDDVAASLSLSLSFSFPDKEMALKPNTKRPMW